MEVIELLEGIGLTKGEIKVYFSLLELGSSTTGKIIKSARVSRSKVYEMLDKLIDKGLVSFIIKGNIKYFEAADPSSILDYLNKQEKTIAEKERLLKNILPQLKEKISYRKFNQTATMYEGLNGIKSIFNDVLSSLKKGQEYYSIASEPTFYYKTGFNIFIKNYHLKRATKGIKARLIADETLKTDLEKTIARSKLIQVRYSKLNLPAATLIYGNNIATFVWSENPTGFIIRSPVIALRYKKFFEDIWKTAKS